MSPCIPIHNGIVTVGGPIIRIATNHGIVAFEWHSFCGPMPVSLCKGRVGDERVLPGKHDFWRKVSIWAQNGRKTQDICGKTWAVLS